MQRNNLGPNWVVPGLGRTSTMVAWCGTWHLSALAPWCWAARSPACSSLCHQHGQNTAPGWGLLPPASPWGVLWYMAAWLHCPERNCGPWSLPASTATRFLLGHDCGDSWPEVNELEVSGGVFSWALSASHRVPTGSPRRCCCSRAQAWLSWGVGDILFLQLEDARLVSWGAAW